MHGKPGSPGHQAVMDVMAVTEPKVIREAQGGLDRKDLLVSWDLLV